MKIVMTGATGAIGMALLEKHVQLGHQILVIVNPNSKRNSRLKKFKNLEIIECDLDKYSKLNINKKFDHFYHLAWQGGSDRENIQINSRSLFASISAVELSNKLGCKSFMGAGSQAECGKKNEKISEKTNCVPHTAFGAAKLSAYYMTSFAAKQYGIRFSWARILSIYGPYDGENTLIISTIKKLLMNKSCEFSSGNQTWDFLYSEDAAEALLNIAMYSKEGGIYTIGSGRPRRLKDYLYPLLKSFDIHDDSYFGKLRNFKNQVDFLAADVSKLKNEFNWQPKYSFENGLKKTIEYCRNNIIL